MGILRHPKMMQLKSHVEGEKTFVQTQHLNLKSFFKKVGFRNIDYSVKILP